MSRYPVPIALIALLMVVSGCAGSSPSQSAGNKTVHGLLTKLAPPYVPGSTVAPQGFTIRADDGVEVSVRIGPKVDTNTWNMLHLNSHLLNGEPLSVTYEDVGGEVLAVALNE